MGTRGTASRGLIAGAVAGGLGVLLAVAVSEGIIRTAEWFSPDVFHDLARLAAALAALAGATYDWRAARALAPPLPEHANGPV